MSYYVSGYYQEKAILKKDGHLFFIQCEEADAPTRQLWNEMQQYRSQNFQKRNNRKFFRLCQLRGRK